MAARAGADAPWVIERLARGRPGRSATRRYKELSRAWRRRVFGRRFGLYFWAIYTLLAVLVVTHRPSSMLAFYSGVLLGGAATVWLLLPDALMPSKIFNWQLGAWGEQNTASELRGLKRQGWVVAHDVRWGKGNHDHIVGGLAVYVLNSKNVNDSEITIEGDLVRVTKLDTNDSYLADRWAPTVEREARTLSCEITQAAGFPVHVYPVVVLWGRFEQRQAYIGEVSVVSGDALEEWLRSRPADLLTPEKRSAVCRVVTHLPRA